MVRTTKSQTFPEGKGVETLRHGAGVAVNLESQTFPEGKGVETRRYRRILRLVQPRSQTFPEGKGVETLLALPSE